MECKQPKFIITGDGTLRLGLVCRHRELLRSGESCLGGGYYELDYVSHRMLLSGMSTDFGEPEWGCVETLRVSAYYRGLSITYSSWEKGMDDILISDIINIEYI